MKITMKEPDISMKNPMKAQSLINENHNERAWYINEKSIESTMNNQ
jgi:hypothetical protein